jgi:hypothetical protein
VLELESAEHLRMEMRVFDDHRLVVGIIAECVQPPQTPRLIPKGSSSVPLGTTSKIRSPLGPCQIQNSATVWDPILLIFAV